jgi:hypothetical protein
MGDEMNKDTHNLQELYENMHGDNWGNTSWSDVINGEEITVTINDLLNITKNVPVIEILTKVLEPIALHKDKKDAITLSNVEKSDLQYPIIVLKKDNAKYQILDGHHRLQKAINNNIENIKAKLIDINVLPDKYQQLFR